MLTTTRRAVCAIAMAATLAVPAVSYAATTSGTVPVSATVVNNCTVGTNSMSFGNYDPAIANNATDLTATGTLSLTCTNGDAVTVAADAGGNGTHATGTTRAMSATIGGSTYYLNYELYTDSGDTTVWNNSNTVAYTGSGTAGTASFYGVIPKAQTGAKAGSYTDTVNITVTF